jgi:hypothetical protein
MSQKPKVSQEARLAEREQRQSKAKDRAKNRALRDLVKVSNTRSGLLGGPATGRATTTGSGPVRPL